MRPAWWWQFRAWLRYRWCVIRRRCITCGRNLRTDSKAPVPNFVNPHMCRMCRKAWAHGMNYGLGGKVAREMLGRGLMRAIEVRQKPH